MEFKEAKTEEEKEKLKEIPKEDFEAIGHKFDDYELDYPSFKQHEREIKEYIKANK